MKSIAPQRMPSTQPEHHEPRETGDTESYRPNPARPKTRTTSPRSGRHRKAQGAGARGTRATEPWVLRPGRKALKGRHRMPPTQPDRPKNPAPRTPRNGRHRIAGGVRLNVPNLEHVCHMQIDNSNRVEIAYTFLLNPALTGFLGGTDLPWRGSLPLRTIRGPA